MPSTPTIRARCGARAARLLLSLAALCTLAAPAYAKPGETGIERFGTEALEWLTNVIGPLAIAGGIIVAAISAAFGSRDGLQRAFVVVIAGVLIFSAASIVEFIRGAV
jgi:type IV secretory pathway VirB2 component (pilin)